MSLDSKDTKETKEKKFADAKGLDDFEDGDGGSGLAPLGFDASGDDDKKQLNPSDQLTIAGALGALAGRDLFSDCTFNVGKGPEQRQIPGHKVILAAASDIFEAMLIPPSFPGEEGKKAAAADSKSSSGKSGLGLGGLDEDDRPTIDIPDVKPHIFKIMLQAIYSDAAEIKAEDLPDLIACANKFQLDSLRSLCVTFMEEGVTPDNACKLFETAESLLGEKHFALNFIEENAEEVVKSAGWDTLPRSRIIALLQSNKLCIDEIDLFKGVMRWALVECKRQVLTDTVENKKKVLEDILPLIRFPIMSMEEIATFVSPSQLLTSGQLLEIFTYLGQKGKKTAKVSFPTQPRGGSRDKWTFDNDLKCNTVTLSNDNTTATNTSGSHSWCQGTTPWTKGKHAWRVVRDTGNTQWLLIGLARKTTHQQTSYNDTTVWGLSSASQRYYAGSATSVTTNFNTGPLDCLYDADAGTMTVMNLSNDQRFEMTGLPTGGDGLVPHFGPHGSQSLSIYSIAPKDFGNKTLVVSRKR